MHLEGRGVLPDYAEAVKWFRRAAEQGHADTQFTLGRMYYAGGGGLPQDDVQAYAWSSIAAAQDAASRPYPDYQGASAAETMDSVAERMTPEARDRAQKLAQQYWEAYVLPFQN